MSTNFLRGHKIEAACSNGTIYWMFSDTGEKTIGNTRPCGYCLKSATEGGEDACIGKLPGLMNACCGHGIESSAYAQLLDGTCIRGKDARVIFEILKRNIENA